MVTRFIAALCLAIAGLAPAGAQTILSAISGQSDETLTIYSTLDEDVSRPLLEAFQHRNREVEIRFFDLQSIDLYQRTIEETDDGGGTADLLISSAMDLQVKLANDGYAQSASFSAQNWPNWAVWRKSVFGLTFEPSVVVYHKPSFADRAVPSNRSEISALLQEPGQAFHGKLGTYDIERSGLGYLFLARDTEHDRNIWRLVRNMGGAGVRLYSSSSSILERVSDGRLALGYNVLGSYAEAWAQKHPELGIVYPEDYTVVMSRIGLVPRAARRPDLGNAMLAFLMSREGQTIMGEELRLAAIHPAVGGENTASSLRERYGSRLRPIDIGPGLVAYLDQVKRTRFIERWNKSLRGE